MTYAKRVAEVNFCYPFLMEKIYRDYTEFLGAIVLFRAARDMDCSCSPGLPPELWLDRHLDSLDSDHETDPETKEWLILAYKMAELIDDRKAWLLEDVEADLKEATANLIDMTGGGRLAA